MEKSSSRSNSDAPSGKSWARRMREDWDRRDEKNARYRATLERFIDRWEDHRLSSRARGLLAVFGVCIFVSLGIFLISSTLRS